MDTSGKKMAQKVNNYEKKQYDKQSVYPCLLNGLYFLYKAGLSFINHFVTYVYFVHRFCHIYVRNLQKTC